jgi:hypothetical protein
VLPLKAFGEKFRIQPRKRGRQKSGAAELEGRAAERFFTAIVLNVDIQQG